MKVKMSKTGIFSGRFDPIHLGHVMTIQSLWHNPKVTVENIDRIIIVILDMPGRITWSAVTAARIFNVIFGYTNGAITAITNKIHFAKISMSEYCEMLSDLDLKVDETVYFSGNHEVIDHVRKMGVPYFFISRTPGFSGTDIRREMDRSGNTVDEHYQFFEG